MFGLHLLIIIITDSRDNHFLVKLINHLIHKTSDSKKVMVISLNIIAILHICLSQLMLCNSISSARRNMKQSLIVHSLI